MQKRKVSSAIISALFALCAAFFLCSCGDYVGKEKTHPLFVKAGTAKSAGNYQEAAACYEEFLLICPKSLLTCKELADLYNDALNNPLKAVYYYERFIQLLPPNAADSSEIRSFAENARKNLYKQLSEQYKSDPALQTDSGELKKLNEQLAGYVEHTRRLTERNRKLVSIIEQMNEERRQINAQRSSNSARAVNPGSAVKQDTQNNDSAHQAARRNVNGNGPRQTVRKSPPAPQTKPLPASALPRKGTVYTVQAGDNLFRISRRFYGTTARVNLIREANPGKIGKNNFIRLGQKLVIPPVPGSAR